MEAFGKDDYAVIGGIVGQPLRLVASETWGEEMLVPADAEMIVEGEILPNEREVEAPFGEFTGYYGPQRVRPVIRVTAITHRRQAILQHAFVGHRDNWILGGIPKEGAIYNTIKGVVPTVKAVHFALSGSGRFNCYISIDKKVPGETKQAALAAFGQVDFIKNIIVVDSDIDPFNEQEVLFAVATRTQAREAVGYHPERQRKHAGPLPERRSAHRQAVDRRHDAGEKALCGPRAGSGSSSPEISSRRITWIQNNWMLCRHFRIPDGVFSSIPSRHPGLRIPIWRIF